MGGRFAEVVRKKKAGSRGAAARSRTAKRERFLRLRQQAMATTAALTLPLHYLSAALIGGSVLWAQAGALRRGGATTMRSTLATPRAPGEQCAFITHFLPVNGTLCRRSRLNSLYSRAPARAIPHRGSILLGACPRAEGKKKEEAKSLWCSHTTFARGPRPLSHSLFRAPGEAALSHTSAHTHEPPIPKWLPLPPLAKSASRTRWPQSRCRSCKRCSST